MLFMNANGTVKRSKKIANATGGGPTLANDDRFGSGVAALGDLDGDGIIDLAVGAETDNAGGGSSRGAVHVLFLAAPHVPGDFNGSGVVDAADYVVWRRHSLGQSGAGTARRRQRQRSHRPSRLRRVASKLRANDGRAASSAATAASIWLSQLIKSRLALPSGTRDGSNFGRVNCFAKQCRHWLFQVENRACSPRKAR